MNKNKSQQNKGSKQITIHFEQVLEWCEYSLFTTLFLQIYTCVVLRIGTCILQSLPSGTTAFFFVREECHVIELMFSLKTKSLTLSKWIVFLMLLNIQDCLYCRKSFFFSLVSSLFFHLPWLESVDSWLPHDLAEDTFECLVTWKAFSSNISDIQEVKELTCVLLFDCHPLFPAVRKLLCYFFFFLSRDEISHKQEKKLITRKQKEKAM